MKYKNYEIIRADERNLQLVRYDDVVADKDITNKEGEVVTKAGEHYTRTVNKGFFGSVVGAFNALAKDAIGRDCSTIEDVVKQVSALSKDIKRCLGVSTI